MSRAADFLGPHGALSEALPDFEYRAGQVEMAARVEETLNLNATLMIEAGTGIGKSFAYLIPALLCGERVVISTATKNLQDQLFEKESAPASEHLGEPGSRGAHEGTRELSLPAGVAEVSDGPESEARSPARRRSPAHRVLGGEDQDRRPGRNPWTSRFPRFLARNIHHFRELHRPPLPAPRGVPPDHPSEAGAYEPDSDREPPFARCRPDRASDRFRRGASRVRPPDRGRSTPARGRRHPRVLEHPLGGGGRPPGDRPDTFSEACGSRSHCASSPPEVETRLSRSL